jgi:hypothetical protein
VRFFLFFFASSEEKKAAFVFVFVFVAGCHSLITNRESDLGAVKAAQLFSISAVNLFGCNSSGNNGNNGNNNNRLLTPAFFPVFFRARFCMG